MRTTSKPKKFTLTTREVLELALMGVQIKTSALARCTEATHGDLAWHVKAQMELERRIKIVKTQEKHDAS